MVHYQSSGEIASLRELENSSNRRLTFLSLVDGSPLFWLFQEPGSRLAISVTSFAEPFLSNRVRNVGVRERSECDNRSGQRGEGEYSAQHP